MTKWVIPDTPSPEAIVRMALEMAALEANAWFYDPEADMVTDTRLANAIRAIASDPAEVAAIIKKAGETNET